MTGAVVVGTGFGCITHVRALRAAGFEVHALVGRDPAKTAARADAVGVPRACTSFAEALALPGADAVTIATPPHTHAPLVLDAVRAGKHVLCEKPFARDAEEARSLLAAARQAGVVHLIGTEFRFDAGQALLARAVHEGAVGEPRLAMFVLHVPVLADRDAELPDWWADAAQGGGWLGAHGSQVIDQIRVTLGEFDAVTAAVVHVARATTADDGFVVHFRMASGCAGVMASTAADRGPLELADDLRTTPPSSPPPELLTTTYERMIGHGTRPRSVHAARRALPGPHRGDRTAGRPAAGHVRRRRRRHGGARCGAPVGRRSAIRHDRVTGAICANGR